MSFNNLRIRFIIYVCLKHVWVMNNANYILENMIGSFIFTEKKRTISANIDTESKPSM